VLVLIQTHPDKTPSIDAVFDSFVVNTTLFTRFSVIPVYLGLLFIAYPCTSRVSVLFLIVFLLKIKSQNVHIQPQICTTILRF